MKIVQKTKYSDLRKKYRTIIGWGAGGECRKIVNTVKCVDYLVDSGIKKGQKIGTFIGDVKVDEPDVLRQFVDDYRNCLIVIFPNIEQEILKNVYEIFPEDVDTIVGRLIDFETKERSYSADREDLIMLRALKYLAIDDFSYMDIGVCHSVIRNNTYLFYENGNYNGVLVEPNVSMVEYAGIYRPENKILNCGATGEKSDDELKYYYDSIRPGLNTFDYEVAKRRGFENNFILIPVKNINTILEENFETYPTVLDIDTEGMDYNILSAIDFERFPIRVICAEAGDSKDFEELLCPKGYRVFEKTKENTVFIREQ